ncbi:origin recognition complex subunit 3 [Tachypleus tridentatus]|uniref:origin recognition complex subunit 3 n=1 Tax=Tachypleus tridentatus TaxID=6853 RepID=UPI003FD2D548
MTTTISEENPLSLSKGCFVHRKKPLQRTKNSKITSEENEDELWSSRKDIYQNLWQMIAKEVNGFQETVHGEVLDAVVSFVLNSYSRSSTIKNVIKEIPTAALIMGVNMPDHSAILQLLFQRLLHSVTNLVVSLHSRDCKTLSAMIQKFVASIMKAGNDDLERLKRQDFTFHSLSAWYQDSNQRKKCIGKSPQKKRKMSDHSEQPYASTPIVILLEDLEAFNCTVLTDFILLCRNYLDKIPIVLVMMIATATVTIHSLLPQQASSCLAIETFYSIPPTEYLTQILQIIINPSVPFNLGPRVIQLLVDVVLFHDFSVANLIHMLKFCLFEHFYTSATTMLCCDQSQLKDRIENLGTSELAAIKELPSFRRYLKNCQSVPGNNTVYKDLVFKLLEELHTYQHKMFGLVGCLHVLVKDLPSHPLGKQMREIYVLALEKNISETPEYTKATKILGMLSRNELEDRLLSCQSFLDNNEIQHWSQLQEVKRKLQEFVTNLHHIKEMANSDETQRKQKQSVIVDFGKMTSRSQLKEKLKDLAQNRKSTEFENCRQTIVDFFTSLFRELVAPSCFPLHEILYFNDAGRVKQHIMAVPRSAICKALVDPAFYLQCTCCSIDDYSQICSSMVDTCVAYKLHLEYGRLINLYDWLQSFKMVKMANDSKKMTQVLKEKRKNKKQDGHDLTLQAQFVQAVSELQFLGFIKPTKRKTDHVARLTWGTS